MLSRLFRQVVHARPTNAYGPGFIVFYRLGRDRPSFDVRPILLVFPPSPTTCFTLCYHIGSATGILARSSHLLEHSVA
jgi:hypothetical protein